MTGTSSGLLIGTPPVGLGLGGGGGFGLTVGPSASGLLLGGAGSPAVLWTPAALGSALVAWWDTSDAATITSSGGTISAIADKSGNGWTLSQATGANQPAYNATGINGFGGASYDNTDKFLVTSSSLIVAQPNTVVSLFQTGASLVSTALVWEGAISSSGSRQILFARRNDSADQPCLYAGTALMPISASALSFNTNYLSAATMNGASSAHNLNGATAITGNPGADGISSGFRWSGSPGTQFNGFIGFSVIANRVLTTTERQKLEGYAAWQFGLNQVVLPPGNPYYSARPTL